MKLKNKILGFLAGTLAIASCVFVGVRFAITPTTAEEVTLSCDLETEYCIGDSITLPEVAELKLSDGTKIMGQNPKIVFPNGMAKGAGTYTLNDLGEYAVYYYATKGGQQIFSMHEFKVEKYNWEYPSTSIPSYGALSLKEGTEGISVDLAAGDTFTFTQRRSLKGLTELDVCRIFPDIKKNSGDLPAVGFLTIKLIDSYDPSIYLEFYLWSQSSGTFYVGAGANHQTLTGLDPSVTGAFVFEGSRYRLWKPVRYATSGVYGAPAGASNTSMLAKDRGGLAFRWDILNNKVWQARVGSDDVLVTDLDAPEIYGENVFTGFPSEEVYLSIQCHNYNEKFMNIQMESLLGYTGEEINRVVDHDTVKPVVTLDVETTDVGGLYLERGKEFAIPMNATATDLNFMGEIAVGVYYNYASNEPIAIHLQDGKFTPNLNGVYTVEYKARDIFGNEGIATLNLNVRDKKAVSYTPEKISSMTAVAVNTLPLIEATGINKEIVTTISVIDSNGVETILDDTRTFVPTSSGEYTVVYTFKDNAYTEVFSYSVSAVDTGEVLFGDKPNLPQYFIKGASYQFEEYTAYKLGESGVESHLAKVEIAMDNGDFTEVSATSACTISGSEKVRVKYTLNGKESAVYERKIIDVDYNGDVRNYGAYFQGDYSSFAGDNRRMIYSFDGENTSAEMHFINYLAFSKFEFGFEVLEEQDKFDSVTITLVDAFNEADKLEISYTRSGRKVVYLVQQWLGGERCVRERFEIDNNFVSTYSVTHKLGQVSNNSGNTVAVQPFKSELVALHVRLDGISDDVQLGVNKINNQNFTGRLTEMKPTLSYFVTTDIYNMGMEYTLPAATMNSVLNPTHRKDALLTVRDPNGDIVTDVNNTALNGVLADKEYTIIMPYSGSYVIEYTYSCQTKRGVQTDTERYLISVADIVAPTIKFEHGLNENSLIKVKVGETHTLVSYTFSDNVTEKENMWHGINVHNSNGMLIGHGLTKYTFTEAGYYIVRAWCMDEYGNTAITYYNVLAE